MVETPCLDSEALSELREVMEDEFDILIQTYVEDSRHRIESLRQALDAGDPTALSRAAHSFKGSCFNIGVMRLGELCLQVETLAKSGDLDGGTALIDTIESEFRLVNQRLSEI
tara:strand:- start:309 stop:647 length:339 start_codon:yes stop_codon:yes gene_type:complete